MCLTSKVHSDGFKGARGQFLYLDSGKLIKSCINFTWIYLYFNKLSRFHIINLFSCSCIKFYPLNECLRSIHVYAGCSVSTFLSKLMQELVDVLNYVVSVAIESSLFQKIKIKIGKREQSRNKWAPWPCLHHYVGSSLRESKE